MENMKDKYWRGQSFCIFINLYLAAVYKCANVFTNYRNVSISMPTRRPN